MALSLLDSQQIISYVLVGVLVVVLIVSMVLLNRRRSKQEKEAQEQMDAIKPGNKVTTIGGVVGIVVAVDPTDQTFVLETGDEEHGKCYVKFLKQAIYQSDAVVDKNKKSDEAKETAEEEKHLDDSAAETPIEVQETAAPEEEKKD